MNRINFFTVCDAPQLPQALVWADSVKHTFAKAWCGIFCIAPNTELSTLQLKKVVVLGIEQWASLEWLRLSESYSIEEMLNAAKPIVAEWVMGNAPAAEAIMYCSPKIWMQHRFELSALNADLTLFPYYNAPMPPKLETKESEYLNRGVASAEAWVLRANQQGAVFLDWWRRRLLSDGKVNYCEGLGSDRLWLMHACSYVAQVHVERADRFHVAPSQFVDRKLRMINNQLVCQDGQLVAFFFMEEPPQASLSQLAKQTVRTYRAAVKQHEIACKKLKFSLGLANPKPLAPWRKQLIVQLSRIIRRIETFRV